MFGRAGTRDRRHCLLGVAVVVVTAIVPAIGSGFPAVAAITDPVAVIPKPTRSLPSARTVVMDPAFGSRIVRVSAGAGGGFESPIYSQLQAFSRGNRFILLDSNQGYVIRRTSNWSKLPVNTSAWNVPRWDPLSPVSILHFDANDNDRVVLLRTNIVTGATSTVVVFPSQYRTVLNNQSFDEISRNGRWLAGMVTAATGRDTMFTVDLWTREVVLLKTLQSFYSTGCTPDPTWGAIEPDWVGVSPLGRYLIVQWPRDGTARCSGLETFSLRTGAFVGRVYDGHQHSDVGVGVSGTTEFLMVFEMYHPSGQLALGVRQLPGNRVDSEPAYVRVLRWGNEGHISCQGPRGECLISTAADPANGWNPYEEELFVQRLNGGVTRLAHTRTSSCSYFTQARATSSTDGRYVAWSSDWNRGRADCTGHEKADPYVLARGHAPLPIGAALN